MPPVRHGLARLRRFPLTVLVSAVLALAAVTAFGYAFGHLRSDYVRLQASEGAYAAADRLELFSSIAPLLGRGESYADLDAEARAEVDGVVRGLRREARVAGVVLWEPDGYVSYSDDQRLQGRRYRLTSALRAALRGTAVSESPDEARDVGDRRRGNTLRAYLPSVVTTRSCASSRSPFRSSPETPCSRASDAGPTRPGCGRSPDLAGPSADHRQNAQGRRRS